MRILGPVKRHKVRAALVAVGLLGTAAVAGPYAYIHLLQGPPPAPLALTRADAEQIADRSPADLDGTWSVLAGSEAGYRVDEKIGGQANTAVGRTEAVTGEVVLDGSEVRTATFEVDLTQVTSDISARDDVFRDSVLETAEFPTATFTLTAPIDLGATPAVGEPVERDVTGVLDLHGVAGDVAFTVQAQRLGDHLEITGSIPIAFADFDVTAPSAGAATTVEDHGQVEFLLTLGRA